MADDRKYSLAYLLFFTVFALCYSSSIVDPVQIPRAILTSCFLTVLSIFLWNDRKKFRLDLSILRRPLPLAMLGFIVCVAVSILSAHVISEALFVTSKVLTSFLFFCVTALLLRSGRISVGSLSKGVGAFALIILIIALYQLVDKPGKPDFIVSTMANKNLLASILFLSLPCLLFNLKKSTLWRLISTITLAGTVLILVFTEARGAILATIAFTAVLVFGYRFFLRSHDPFPKFTRIAAPALVLAIVGGALVVFQFQSRFSGLLDSTTLSERKVLWSNTVEMIQDHPITGVGAGNWKIHNNAYGLEGFRAKAGTGLEIFQRPHNDYLWVFSETGVIGFLVYLIMLGLSIHLCIVRIRGSNGSSEVQLHLMLLGTLIGYILIAAFAYPFERVEQQVFLSMYFAILLARPIPADGKKQAVSSTPMLFLGTLALVLVATSYLYLKRLDGELHTAKVYVAKGMTNWNAMIAEADLAINPFFQLDASSTPLLWYKGVAQFALDDKTGAHDSFMQALEISPNDIHVLTNIATGYAIKGDIEQAESYFERTISIAPVYANPRLNMCKLRYQQGRFEEAFEYIEPLHIDLKDKLYQDFLPVLLKKKSEALIDGLNDAALINRINGRITSKPVIVELYRQAKEKNLSFEKYLMTL